MDLDTPIAVGESLGGTGSLNEFSPTWIFVKNHAEAEIKKLRERNDSVALGIEHTAYTRGKIEAMKELIALPRAGQRKAGLMQSSQSSE